MWVLFQINWEWDGAAFQYFLNAGAYDSEKEILLMDGTALEVISVEDVLDDNDKKLYTRIALKK